jgi:hypothetical protein
LLPYESGGRLLDLAAEPVGLRRLPAGITDLVAALSAQPLELRMLVAPAGGAWRPFGLLRIGGQAWEGGDGDVRFDPVLNPLPGLEFPRWVRELREPAYAGARDRASRNRPGLQAEWPTNSSRSESSRFPGPA